MTDSDFIKVGTIDEIPEGQVKVFELDGDRITVCNVSGSLYAVSDICSHDYALLSEGELENNEITCPRHGARFDVKTGKALCLPAVVPVQTYAVEVRGNEVWLSPTQPAKTV